jgi:transposase
MIKHTDQFKREVVDEYLEGMLGFRRLAARHNIASPTVRRWVSAFRLHGDDGLRRKVERYTAAFKLSVLEHMWENALTYNQAAAVFNIRNPTSVGIWDRRYSDGGFEALAHQPRTLSKINNMKVPTSKPDAKPDGERSRDDLLEELEYLRMENVVLKKLQALVQAQKKDAPKKRK